MRAARPLLTLMAVAALTLSLSAADTASAGASGAVAFDAFDRAEATGWGTADSGQRWITGNWPGVRLTGSAGVMTLPAPGSARRAVLARPRLVNVRMRFSANIDRQPGQGVTIIAEARRAKAGSYQAHVRVTRGGRVWLSFHKVRRGGSSRVIGRNRLLPWSYQAGDRIIVRFEALGRNSTRLRLKAWREGTTVPPWQLVGRDRKADLEAKGNVGLRAALATDSAAGAVSVSFDDVRVDRVRVAAKHPARSGQSKSSPDKDTSAPKLVDVDVRDIAETTAEVKWTLSEPATSFVRFGKTADYGSQSDHEATGSDRTLVQRLAGLDPGSTYHYSVVAVDNAQNRLVSRDRTLHHRRRAAGR